MFGFVRSILGFNNKKAKAKLLAKAKAKESNYVKKTGDILISKFKSAILESKVIIKKLEDLHKTNYDLGSMHLDKGNLREAAFRFRLVRKFWPKDYKSHIKLIYCYLMLKNEVQADRAIRYFLDLEPMFKSKIEELKRSVEAQSKDAEDDADLKK
jgi:Flp pilus assembly protein TadD